MYVGDKALVRQAFSFSLFDGRDQNPWHTTGWAH